ncbi:ribosome hibernation-promoting factor, HPF/YfiA family [Silvanigrella aquatica]|uniref:Ribosomal subunit interface protein n=1 Tax=Silvanigrella aquatica TaxID=1915309 RepID=A0A1L4D2J4_9BACT|nr:ribosome-associated translation inhibitor RaiA [Silvanigrella aquatica]APJ04411.1 ribosomal subunit interface protein [Silvanigrella aquatica]
MQVEVHFVNFPKSKQNRSIVEQKIIECIEKYSSNIIFVKAFFSVDGFEHHVKISVSSGRMSTFVNASAGDIYHSIDKVLNKLESSLRRVSKKKMHKRNEFSSVSEKSDYNATNLRIHKRFAKINENVFDKFENAYVSDFEDDVRPMRKVS